MGYKTKVGSKLEAQYVAKVVEVLEQKGKELVETAYRSSEFEDDTYNLRDSYGYAVYYNGKVKAFGGLDGRKATTPKKQSVNSKTKSFGRDDFEQYVKMYGAKSYGFELIVVAVKFYAGFLEDGTRTNRKYKVISQIWDKMEDFGSQFKGTIKQIRQYE